jgi:hypothetical protein
MIRCCRRFSRNLVSFSLIVGAVVLWFGASPAEAIHLRPIVTSVTASWLNGNDRTRPTLRVVIKGSGFGRMTPYIGDSNFLRIRVSDPTHLVSNSNSSTENPAVTDFGWNHWSYGRSCWNKCSDSAHANVISWASSRVVVTFVRRLSPGAQPR